MESRRRYTAGPSFLLTVLVSEEEVPRPYIEVIIRTLLLFSSPFIYLFFFFCLDTNRVLCVLFRWTPPLLRLDGTVVFPGLGCT